MSREIKHDRIPVILDIERITGVDDPIIRNLQITHCYHELSQVMAGRLGLQANWCTFATWASKQAGQTIRKEDLEQMVRATLQASPELNEVVEAIALSLISAGTRHTLQKIRNTIWEVLGFRKIVASMSMAIATGNLKVFAEIGREFARFIESTMSDPTFQEDVITRFCEELLPGDPPSGQQYLRDAFSWYYQALFETNLKTRAELLLLANIEIGFHEQTRLQPEIARAMNAAIPDPDEIVRRLLSQLFPFGGWYARTRLFTRRLLGKPLPLDVAAQTFVTLARRRIRTMLTEHLMTIGLPGGVRLRLGRDLDTKFPVSLQQITNSELLALLSRIDPSPDSLEGSGAIDWADLPDRLHFIADMFRVYQERQELLQPPFTNAQVSRIKAGVLPEGPL